MTTSARCLPVTQPNHDGPKGGRHSGPMRRCSRGERGTRLLSVRILVPLLLGVTVVASACQGEGIEASPTTTTVPQTVPKFVASKYGGPANYVINPSFEDRLNAWG